MIRIQRNNQTMEVVLSIVMPTAGSYNYTLTWEAGSVPHADLLVSHAQKSLRDRLQNIRQQAYEEGWKDAKGKRRRRESFFGGW